MPRLKRTELALVTFSIVLSLFGIELATRLYDHKLTTWTNFLRVAYIEMARPKTREHVYDPELGWRSRPGCSEAGQHVDERGFRIAGPLPSPARGGPILLAGDSNTFGNEVSDEEAWAAHLQALTGRPMLKAGDSSSRNTMRKPGIRERIPTRGVGRWARSSPARASTDCRRSTASTLLPRTKVWAVRPASTWSTT